MKTKISIAVLLALAVLASLGVLNAFADGSTVAYLDNQTHSLGANSSALYKFDYAMDPTTNTRPITTITLVNGTNSGLGFQVWTPDKVGDMADNTPVGQGTAQSVDCDTGDIGGGACQSADLTWTGAFGTSGTYYVLVTNNNSSQASFTLNIKGDGVSLGQQMASAPSAPAPAAAPALSATSTGVDDPSQAAALDASQHSLPAGGATWYSFNYQVNDDGSRPVVTITLPNGAANGMAFQIWTPDELQGGWFNNTPIGQGTAQHIDCDTGNVIGSGQCTSPDLVWKGALGGTGTYYVRVLNGGSAPANYGLMMQ